MIRHLARLAAVLGAAFTLLLLAATPALAQEIPNDAPATDVVSTLTIPALLVYFVTTLLIPVATGYITQGTASAATKQLWTGLFATINGLLVTATQADGTALLSLTTVVFALVSWLVATFTYRGFYKPHLADDSFAPGIGFSSFLGLGRTPERDV